MKTRINRHFLLSRRPLLTLLLLSLTSLLLAQHARAEGADSAVVINEIQYHPVGSDGEWIELRNLMGVDVDLSGWRFADGIDYEFPEGTILPGRGYLVVAENPGEAIFNGITVLGPFQGGISNGGETIELANRNGRVMDRVDYNDAAPWPLGPDGSGATLAANSGNRVAMGPDDWHVSLQPGGTPGAENFPAGIPDPTLVINEITGGLATPFQVELKNLSNAPIDLEDYVLQLGGVQNGDFLLPAQSLAAGGYVVFDEDDLGYVPLPGDRLFLYSPAKTALLDAREVDQAGTGRHNDGRWLLVSNATFGSANSFSLETDIVINEIMYHAAPQLSEAGTPAEQETVVLSAMDAIWLYNESGNDLGSTWAQSSHSLGGDWQSGAGPIGYETDSPPITLNTTLTDPDDNNPFVVTYYFEREFNLTQTQLDHLDSLTLRHMVDDGAVIYLNGVEIFRYQMPSGTPAASTLSTGNGDASLEGPVTVPSNALVAGTNRLSVEVHQNSIGSSDIVFGVELTAETVTDPGTPGPEFMESPEQWVELYNRGSTTVDLSGWQFADGIDYTFPNGTSLAAGEYLLVAWDVAAMQSAYPQANVAGPFSGNISNSGERLLLVDANGNPADEVRYFDGGRWPEFADGGGSSLELRDPDADNSQPGAWRASDESHRGEWETFSWQGTPGYGLHGSGSNKWDEFVFGLMDTGSFLVDDVSVIEDPDGAATELIQNSTFDSGTDSWRLLGTHRHFSLVDDPDSPGNQVLRIDVTRPTEHQYNHVETTLKSASGFVDIDANEEYAISFRLRWIAGARACNARLYHNRLARRWVLPVQPGGGTPGAANSELAPNLGPLFTNLSHSPVVPDIGVPATVTVDAEDNDGVSSATLHYSVEGGSWQSVAMSATGGSQWTAQIPGQSAGARVQFYVEASDSAGAARFEPAEGPDSRAMILWEDGNAQLAVNGVTPTNVRILMTQEDAEWMHYEGHAMSNDMIGCTVVVNESDVYYDAGVRIKGSARGRTVPARVSYSLAFPTDAPFMGVHERISIDRSGPNEGTSMREILFKHAVNHAGGGVPATQDDVIRVIAPNRLSSATSPSVGTIAGPALLNRTRYDDEFLANQWTDGNEGEVFEYELIYRPNQTIDGTPEGLKRPREGGTGTIYRQDFVDLGPDKETYRWHWQIKNNRKKDRYDHLIEFVGAMGDEDSPNFHETMAELTDLDQWLRGVATYILFGVSDSYVGSTFQVGLGHNMAIYFRPEDDKALFIPWDADFAFELHATEAISNSEKLGDDLDHLIADPANRRLYYGHLLDIIDTSYNTAYLTAWAQHYSLFSDGENLTTFMGYVNTRAAHVRNRVETAIPPVNYAIATPDGTTTTDSEIAISGQGWVDVRNLQLQGAESPLEVQWTDATTWRAVVPIASGSQDFTVEAYDFQGNLLGTDTITVTGESSVAPASSSNLVITRIHYHPADPTSAEISAGFDDKDDFEFLELRNIAETTISLAGVSFTEGVDFDFASGQTLDPGETLLLVEDLAAFTERYGSGPAALVAGAWSGGLSNGGEQLRLESSGTGVIRDFTYDDSAPWPEGADGDGPALVLFQPQDNPDHALASNWRASISTDGGPGEPTPQPYQFYAATYLDPAQLENPLFADPTADGDGDGVSNLIEYAFNTNLASGSERPVIPLETYESGGSQYAGIQYTVYPDKPDLALMPALSTNLVHWRTPADGGSPALVAVEGSPVTNADGSQTYHWRSSETVNSSSRIFLRININQF